MSESYRMEIDDSKKALTSCVIIRKSITYFGRYCQARGFIYGTDMALEELRNLAKEL